MNNMNSTGRVQHPSFGVEDGGLLERSLIYREFLAEREEILRHKWFESAKAGRDIGFENALVSWVIYHRARWRKERRQHVREMAGG